MSEAATAIAGLPPQIKVSPYRHEKALFGILATLALVFWGLLTVGTLGAIWIYMVSIYLFVLFAHSALIAFLKGNAVRITEEQFPDLYEQILACCWRLGIATPPEAYLMSGDGMLNAFATRFLRRYYVVLLSDVVDALADDPEANNFYIGHELGHIDRKHIANGWWMGPALIVPILGTAYRRAQEYTCDQYGLACCGDAKSASRALAVLAAGTQRWKTLNTAAYVEQCRQTGGFWMSVNELASDYPWLCKRMAHINAPGIKLPARHPLAWLLAMFMPRFGPGGSLGSLLIVVFMVGILAAIALPAYQDYTLRSTALPAFTYGEHLTKAAGDYFDTHNSLPENIGALGLGKPAAAVKGASLGDDGDITLSLAGQRVIVYSPSLDDKNRIEWACTTNLPAKAIPSSVKCESMAGGKGGFGALESLFGL